jgi:hypothetical protein
LCQILKFENFQKYRFTPKPSNGDASMPQFDPARASQLAAQLEAAAAQLLAVSRELVSFSPAPSSGVPAAAGSQIPSNAQRLLRTIYTAVQSGKLNKYWTKHQAAAILGFKPVQIVDSFRELMKSNMIIKSDHSNKTWQLSDGAVAAVGSISLDEAQPAEQLVAAQESQSGSSDWVDA